MHIPSSGDSHYTPSLLCAVTVHNPNVLMSGSVKSNAPLSEAMWLYMGLKNEVQLKEARTAKFLLYK